MTGLLLIGHGTRSTVGLKQFLYLADRLADRLAPLPVEPAFLELQQPDIDTAITRLLDRGINRLVTMPLLLFAAGHAKQDIPDAVKSALARQNAAHIEQVQAPHLGCHPALVELSKRRMQDALVGWAVPTIVARNIADHGGHSPPYCLLLVGRGSHDESATAEMHQFARLREQNVGWAMPTSAERGGHSPPYTKVEVAFLAMARPLLAEQLDHIGKQGYRQVFVQPHLLFHGDLSDSIKNQVAHASENLPRTQWLLAPLLADLPGVVTSATQLIEKVILDRCKEAGIHVVEPASDD